MPPGAAAVSLWVALTLARRSSKFAPDLQKLAPVLTDWIPRQKQKVLQQYIADYKIPSQKQQVLQENTTK